MENIFDKLKDIKGLDETAMALAEKRQNSLLKPLNSLGELEKISIKMAGITGQVNNTIEKKVLFLFGSDNGIYEEGIASSPQHFTNLLISLYASEKNCAINVLCKQNNVELKLIDIGVIGNLDYSNIDNKKLMSGTNNFLKTVAIPTDIVLKAIEVGFEYSKFAFENNYKIVGIGEVGIGNTTTAAACIMSALEIFDTSLAVGRGAGLTDEAFENKKIVIEKSLALHKPNSKDAIDILSKIGGLDIAAMVGVYIGCAYFRIPVVVDGVISIAAALLANIITPLAKDFMFPSHISAEPAFKLAANKLNFNAYLNLEMRLGEGTGCPLSMNIIENALAIINNMSTFEDLSLDSDFLV